LHNVKVVNDCRGLTVLTDSLLRQLFYNLIDNSLKHGEKVSRIRLHYEEVGKDKLKLVYEDDGIGIPKAEKEKIFKEGYGKGTGYGLISDKENVRSLRLDHPRNRQARQRSPIHHNHTQSWRKRQNKLSTSLTL
jgi:signal transduction histidine kinase